MAAREHDRFLAAEAWRILKVCPAWRTAVASCCGRRRDRRPAALAGRGEDGGGGRTRGPRPPWLSSHEAPRQPGRVLVSCTVSPRPDARRRSPCLGKGPGRRVFPFRGPEGPAPETPFGEFRFLLGALPQAVGPQRLGRLPVSFPRRVDGGGEGRETLAPQLLPSNQAAWRGWRHLLLPSRLRAPESQPRGLLASALTKPGLRFSLSRRHFLVRLGDGVCGVFGDTSGRKTLAASG